MKKIIYFTLLTLLVLSCSNEDETSDNKNFDVQKLRSEFINEIETSLTNNFINSTTALNESILLFLNDLTEGNLLELQKQWESTALAFSSIEVMDIGAIRTSLIMTSFYSWEADETSINSYIASGDPITASVINSRPTNTRGLGAIEFLIFEKPTNETLSDFSDERRKTYLKTLGENLIEKSQILNTTWTGYREEFISNNQTGINGGVNMLVNQLNVLLENVKRFKLGEPAGLENSAIKDVSALQAEKSKQSLLFIEENINSIKKILFQTDNSIVNYAKYIADSSELEIKLINQFTLIEGNISAIKGDTTIEKSLEEAINSNSPFVQDLYENIQSLIVLIKVDLASTLSITITFTDNDGD